MLGSETLLTKGGYLFFFGFGVGNNDALFSKIGATSHSFSLQIEEKTVQFDK